MGRSCFKSVNTNQDIHKCSMCDKTFIATSGRSMNKLMDIHYRIVHQTIPVIMTGGVSYRKTTGSITNSARAEPPY